MEELVSTEALEKEILQDARKKAERLLRDADEEARRVALAGQRRKEESAAELERCAKAGAERHRAEALARLPLERARMRAAFVDEKLRDAVGAYLEALPAARVEALAAAWLSQASDYLGGKELKLRARGLDEAAAARVARSALPGSRIVQSVVDASLTAPGVVAEAADGSALMRATLDLARDSLLGERRGELAEALCPEALSL